MKHVVSVLPLARKVLETFLHADALRILFETTYYHQLDARWIIFTWSHHHLYYPVLI